MRTGGGLAKLAYNLALRVHRVEQRDRRARIVDRRKVAAVEQKAMVVLVGARIKTDNIAAGVDSPGLGQARSGIINLSESAAVGGERRGCNEHR